MQPLTILVTSSKRHSSTVPFPRTTAGGNSRCGVSRSRDTDRCCNRKTVLAGESSDFHVRKLGSAELIAKMCPAFQSPYSP